MKYKIENLFDKDGSQIVGPLLIKPQIFSDQRGDFFESWNKRDFQAFLENVNFVQENQSISSKGVLRGLHYQVHPKGQGKLIMCQNGEIFDVFVDIRCQSETFKKYSFVNISSSNKNILWIPHGFAHGFLSLSENTRVIYKTTEFWDKNSERTILWDDPELDIKWPLSKYSIQYPVLSNKDLLGSTLNDLFNNRELFL